MQGKNSGRGHCTIVADSRVENCWELGEAVPVGVQLFGAFQKSMRRLPPGFVLATHCKTWLEG